MKPTRMLMSMALMFSTVTMLVAAPMANAHGSGAQNDSESHLDFRDRISLARVLGATARFNQVSAAEAANYEVLRDAAGIACIDNPGVGGMGIHYVKGDLVGNPAIDPLRPEALVYEPQRNGRLKLVAVEYVTFQAAWDATHSKPPSLFGRDFALVPAGNRYGLDPFYELHAWIWESNPLGLFNDWNPRVSCAAAPG